MAPFWVNRKQDGDTPGSVLRSSGTLTSALIAGISFVRMGSAGSTSMVVYRVLPLTPLRVLRVDRCLLGVVGLGMENSLFVVDGACVNLRPPHRPIDTCSVDCENSPPGRWASWDAYDMHVRLSAFGPFSSRSFPLRQKMVVV